MKSLSAIFAPLLTILAAAPVPAQCPLGGQIRLLVGGPEANRINAIDADTEVIVAGGSTDSYVDIDAVFSRAGRVTVFRRQAETGAWLQEQRLFGSPVQPFEQFGTAVAVDGDVLAVGAFGSAGPAGVVQGHVTIFRYQPELQFWAQVQRLTPGAGISGFGQSVALDGDVLVVSARPDGVVVYRSAAGSFVEEQTLSVPAITVTDPVHRVALEGDRILVGSPATESAHLFEYDADGARWVEAQTLASEGADKEYRFGIAVALRGNRAVVGADLDDGDGETDTGAVYVFGNESGSFVQQARLTPSDGQVGDRFGTSVSLSERGFLLVGASQVDLTIGAAYVFREVEGGWEQDPRLLPAFPQETIGYGTSVDWIGDEPVVASEGEEIGLPGSVTVHIPLDPFLGTVNAGAGDVVDVLFLNGSAGTATGRRIEYDVLAPFSLQVVAPPTVPAPSTAPFAIYAWPVEADWQPQAGYALPFDLGCTVLPTPLTEAEPQPAVIWNNARRTSRLGVPTRDSRAAPSFLLDLPGGLRRVARFYVQGLIYDPGSASRPPASVTNGITATPVLGR